MKDLLLALKELTMFYRPIKQSGLSANLRCFTSLVIGYPTAFVMPALLSVWKAVTGERGALNLFIISLFHFIASPIILAWSLILPFFGCRIYMHTEASRVLIEMAAKMREEDARNA
jgi:type II secretory pathway component PulF